MSICLVPAGRGHGFEPVVSAIQNKAIRGFFRQMTVEGEKPPNFPDAWFLSSPNLGSIGSANREGNP